MEIREGTRKSETLKEGSIFEIKKGEKVFIGSSPQKIRQLGRYERYIQIEGFPRGSLSRLALEIRINEQGNVRAVRGSEEPDYSAQNPITVLGQDRKRGSVWTRWHLVEELPSEVYERIDGGSVIIDIETERGIVRLNDAGRSDESRLFRVEINPSKKHLDR